MKMRMRAWLLATSLARSPRRPDPGRRARRCPPAKRRPVTVAAPNVRAGIDAWQAGNYALAIGNWRPLADRGDADAQYNIAQAYFLGRGVPQNANLAEQWYERAARQGHEQAQANYGLLLFQNGRRREAMPWIEQAANRGDPRAQYVLGTALFNGDLVGQDLPRAYALMSRAAGTRPAAGGDPARRRWSRTDLRRGPRRAAPTSRPHCRAAPRRSRRPRPLRRRSRSPRSAPPRSAPQTRPIPAPAQIAPSQPPAQTRPRRSRRAQRPAAPASLAGTGGRWRIQLGAFSSEANARRAWGAVAGRLAGPSAQLSSAPAR